MLTVALTLLALGAGLALAHALGVRGLAARAVVAGTLTCAEIVGLELVLGAAGMLTRPALAGASAALSTAGLALSLAALGRHARTVLRADAVALREAGRELRRPEIAILAVLAVVAWCWVVAAVVYLPPRSIDDLNYHLPPMLEAAVRGRLVLLPLDFRPQVAHPFDADLLFLWPTILRGDLTWTDGAQVATAALAAVAVLALALELGASRRAALLGAVLFLLLPLTLKQATSCYVDVTVAAFYGAALWGAVRHARDGSPAALLVAGLGSGLLAGTKYHFLFLLLALVPLALLGLRHAPSRGVAVRRAVVLFVLPAVALGIYWYARNLLVLGNPFYPFRLGLGPWTVFPSAVPGDTATAPSFLEIVFRYPAMPFAVSLRDVSAGSVDGGLGPLFWGAAIPLGVIHALRGLWRPSLVAGVALQLLVALVPYLVIPALLFEVTPRFLLAAAVPGFALLVLSLDEARRRWPGPGALATGLAVLAAGLSTTPIAASGEPYAQKQLMRFAEAARPGEFASPWRFIRDASFGVGRLAPVWDLLDLVSAPPGEPVRSLWVYATGPFPAGFYGSAIQNRIWNFGAPNRPAEPDVLVYFFEKRQPESVSYYGTPGFRWPEVVTQPGRYDQLPLTADTVVFFRRELLAPGGALRERLARYLEQTHPAAVATASSLAPRPERGTIIATEAAGLGLKALELRGTLPVRVVVARGEDVARTVSLVADGGPVLVAGPSGQRAGRVAATMGDRLSLYEVRP